MPVDPQKFVNEHMLANGLTQIASHTREGRSDANDHVNYPRDGCTSQLMLGYVLT